MIQFITSEKMPTKKSSGTENQIHIKNCGFPGCGKEFEGRRKSKYCEEHKKAIYHKQLYAKPNIKHIDSINQTIKPPDVRYIQNHKCSLKNCFNKFDFTVLPNIETYPKYCPDHRNEHKRNLFLQQYPE